MGATPRMKLSRWLAASLLVLGLALALVLSWRAPEVTPDPMDAARQAQAPRASRSAPPSPSEPAAPSTPALAPLPEPARTSSPAEPSPVEPAPAAHPVDLVRLREVMPDNLYWRLGAPTRDEALLRWREEETRRWNTEWGKVQSNTATEPEIHAYFEHRRAVSEDFLQFARRVLEDYGPRLSEQERGLYELSIRMHTTRLEEIPRQTEEALAGKQRQDGLREAWRNRTP
ncbi:hypothetical protein [Melittangium boletus]|uniref:hypothetical protein n=1 Tax=Melittangium boletus TaxID=83453 RepID=UPI003DA61573